MNKLREIYESIFHPPKHNVLAARELENAKRHYLSYISSKEYYDSLAKFEAARIKRLEEYLKEVNYVPQDEPIPFMGWAKI